MVEDAQCWKTLKDQLQEKHDNTLKEVVENYEKEIDQLKQKHRKSIVYHVKTEKSYQEKITELQLKYDDLSKELDILKSNEHKNAPEHEQVNVAVNKQLDEEEIQCKVKYDYWDILGEVKGTKHAKLQICNCEYHLFHLQFS